MTRRLLQVFSAGACLFLWAWIIDLYRAPTDAWWNSWWTPLAAFGAGAGAAALTRPRTWWLLIPNAVSFVLWGLWLMLYRNWG